MYNLVVELESETYACHLYHISYNVTERKDLL